MTNSQDRVKLLTPEGRRKAEEELHHLKTEKRRLIAAKIEAAKELGDLTENAEYAEAKDEQAFNEARVVELTDLLKYAATVSSPGETKDVVAVGSTVRVEGDFGERTYVVVGFNEASPSAGKISNESPLGQALIGRRVGETVSYHIPSGLKQLIIKEIS